MCRLRCQQPPALHFANSSTAHHTSDHPLHNRHRDQHRKHVGRPSDLAHAQIHPKPSPGPQADGRVRTPSPSDPAATTSRTRTSQTHQCCVAHTNPASSAVMSSTRTDRTSARTSSAPSSPNSTNPPRTRSPSSASRRSMVVARARGLRSSMTRRRQ